MIQTAPYAALLALIHLFLTYSVIVQRARAKVSLGDGGDARLLEAMRRQANFVENVPLALILMAMAEASGAPPQLITAGGIALVAGRLVHPLGLSASRLITPTRFVGTVLTSLVQLAMAGFLLFHWL